MHVKNPTMVDQFMVNPMEHRESCGARLCKARLMHKDMTRPTAERPQTAALLFYFLLFSMKQQKFRPSALQVRPPARP